MVPSFKFRFSCLGVAFPSLSAPCHPTEFLSTSQMHLRNITHCSNVGKQMQWVPFSSRIPELLCMVGGRCRRFIPAKESYSQARQEPSNKHLGTIKQFECRTQTQKHECRTQTQKHAGGRWGPGGNARCQPRSSSRRLWALCQGSQGSSRPGWAALWAPPGSAPAPASANSAQSTPAFTQRGFLLQHERGTAVKASLADWVKEPIFNACGMSTSSAKGSLHTWQKTRGFVKWEISKSNLNYLSAISNI